MKSMSTPFWVAVLFLLNSLVSFAQLPPQLTELKRLTNREMVLKYSAPTGSNYRVETSADLLDWSPLLTLPPTTSGQYTDTAAPLYPARFYRSFSLASTNILTGDHISTTNGDIVIHPINHACFVMTWNGLTIYNDPVNSSGRFNGLPKASLILVTHDHGDHFDVNGLNAVKNTNTIILAPQAVYNGMSTVLKGITTVLTNKASINVLGLTVLAVPAYDITGSINHAKGVGNGYLLTMGGKRLYISSDTDDTPEMHALRDLDVAFLAIDSTFTMSIAAALSVVREVRPKIVFPYHYSPSGSPTDLNSFKNQVGTDIGVEVRIRKWY
jgi:L-ascorbate metabolism protein UlaG (beta-lactamase superfamily)